MNTGQRLVSLSGLPSGTAMQHFLAISEGGGVVFASRSITRLMRDVETVTDEQIEPSIVVSRDESIAIHFQQPRVVVRTRSDSVTTDETY